MAIITEYFRTREDGVVLDRTYSNAGMMIERELGRTYTETDEPIDIDELEE